MEHGTLGGLALLGRSGGVRLQAVQERDGALRMGGGREDRPLIIGEDLQPGCEVARMIGPRLELRRDAQIGAKKAAPEF